MFDPIIVLDKARVINDPEIKQSQKGQQYLTFTVASQGRYKDKATGEWKDAPNTMWLHITEFDTGMIAAYQQWIRKGLFLRVEGQLQWRAATDRNGQPTVYFDVRFPRISILVNKVKDTAPQQQPPVRQSQPAPPADPWANANPSSFGGFATTEF